jgi:hypothetical protein
VLLPEFGQARPFRIDEVSRYDERGPAWYWNNSPAASTQAHTSTRRSIDFGSRPAEQRDRRSWSRVIGAACGSIAARSRGGSRFPDGRLPGAERSHGRIPERSWVLMRTDWSKRSDPVAYQNFDETGQHTPGPDAAVVRFLVEERDVIGFGSEAIGTDAGQGFHLKPPYPCHYYMHGNGRYGLQCLTNLDLLPPTGAVIFFPPLKIRQGSGSPLRVLALIEEPPSRKPARRRAVRARKARR